MNNEERQKILQRAAKRKSQAASGAPLPNPGAPPTAAAPAADAPQPYIRATGGAQIRIVDEANPATEVRTTARRQGVVQRPAGPGQSGPRTMGARVVNQEDLAPGPKMRPTHQPGVYGGVVQGQSAPASVGQALRTPIAPQAPAPAQVPAPPVPGTPDLGSQIQSMGSTMQAQGAAPGSVAMTTAPATAAAALPDLTVVMSQHVRPQTLEQQYRALRAAGVDDTAMRCWVNPNGVPLNDGLIGRLPNFRASSDAGPWMRWTLVFSIPTKYALVIDDDCVPGPEWIRLALARLERAEAEGDKLVVAAAGTILKSDRFDDVLPIGPESLNREESDVDLGRGAWLMRTDYARGITNFPQVGCHLATATHVAAATQHQGLTTVVLPYPHDKRSVWGMLNPPDRRLSMSARIAREAQQGGGPSVAALRQADYEVYREVGWEPLCVMAAQAEEETAKEADADEADDS